MEYLGHNGEYRRSLICRRTRNKSARLCLQGFEDLEIRRRYVGSAAGRWKSLSGQILHSGPLPALVLHLRAAVAQKGVSTPDKLAVLYFPGEVERNLDTATWGR